MGSPILSLMQWPSGQNAWNLLQLTTNVQSWRNVRPPAQVSGMDRLPDSAGHQDSVWSFTPVHTRNLICAAASTDTYTSWPNTGNIVSYDLKITNTTCNPDGNGARVCML